MESMWIQFHLELEQQLTLRRFLVFTYIRVEKVHISRFNLEFNWLKISDKKLFICVLFQLKFPALQKNPSFLKGWLIQQATVACAS